MSGPVQRPLELILARNLLSSLSTPACLLNEPADLVFYNDAAGILLGRRFEEQGAIPASDWVPMFGPFDYEDNPIPLEEQPIVTALRQNRPAHAKHRIRSVNGAEHWVEVSAVPVIGADGFQGGILFFWVSGEGGV